MNRINELIARLTYERALRRKMYAGAGVLCALALVLTFVAVAPQTFSLSADNAREVGMSMPDEGTDVASGEGAQDVATNEAAKGDSSAGGTVAGENTAADSAVDGAAPHTSDPTAATDSAKAPAESSDTESTADWDAMIAALHLDKLSPAERARAIAQSQVGYTAIDDDAAAGHDGVTRAWNRFGAAAGDPYADARVMLSGFVLGYTENDVLRAPSLDDTAESYADDLAKSNPTLTVEPETLAKYMARVSALKDVGSTDGTTRVSDDAQATLTTVSLDSETPAAPSANDVQVTYDELVSALNTYAGALVVLDNDTDGTPDALGFLETIAYPSDEQIAPRAAGATEHTDEFAAARAAQAADAPRLQVITANNDGDVVREVYAADDAALRLMILVDDTQLKDVQSLTAALSAAEQTRAATAASPDATPASTDTTEPNDTEIADENTELADEITANTTALPAESEETLVDPEDPATEESAKAALSENIAAAGLSEAPSPLASYAVATPMMRSFSTMLTSARMMAATAYEGTPTTEDIVVGDLTLSTGVGDKTEHTPAVDDSKTYQRWTGEMLSSTISINRTDVSDTNTKRVYIQFSNDQGKISGDLNYAVQDEPFYSSADTLKAHPYYLRKVDGVDNTYYFEFPPSNDGAAFQISIRTYYPSPDSGGGDAKLWAVDAAPDEPQNSYMEPANGLVHAGHWSTVVQNYTATKVQTDKQPDWNKPRLQPTFLMPIVVTENGEDKQVYSPTAFSFQISANAEGRSGIRNEKNGVDKIQTYEYTDILTLPEGMRINPEIMAFMGTKEFPRHDRSNHYSGSTLALGWHYEKYSNYQGFDYPTTHDTADGKNDGRTNFFVLGDATYMAESDYASVQIIDDRHLKLTFKAGPKNYGNRPLTPTYAHKITFEQGAFVVDEPLDDQGQKKTFSVSNDVTEKATYSYSDPRETSANAQIDIALKDSTVKLTKQHSTDSKSFKRGDTVNFTITAKVDGSFDVHQTKLRDTLPNMYYLTPAQISALFNDATQGKHVSITIEHARRISPVTNTEIRTAGGSANATPDYWLYQPNGEMSHPPYEPADHTTSLDSKITFTWNADATKLVMTCDGQTQEIFPDEESIKAALASLGYVVQYQTVYGLSWDIPNGILKSQSVTEYQLSASAKDSFMLARSGNMEMGTYEDQFLENQVSVQDVNKAVIEGDLSVTATDTAINAAREFKILKAAQIDGGARFTRSNQDEVIATAGQVSTYHLHVDRTASDQSPDYDALPLIDELSGVHILRAPAIEENAFLAKSPYNLTVQGEGEQAYYVLGAKDGSATQYHNVTFKGMVNNAPAHFVASNILVKPQGDAGTPTTIEWFLHTADYPKTAQIEVVYDAEINTDTTGYNPPAGTKPEVSNTQMLGGLQSQRLWDQITYPLAKLGADKKIVVNKNDEADPSDDEVVASTKLEDGVEVTYRLGIKHVGADTETLTSRDFWDELPLSISREPWARGVNVVSVEIPDGQPAQVKGADSWYISDDPPTGEDVAESVNPNGPNQQYLRFGDDFEMKITGDTYVYVTLKFPSNDAWEEYQSAYSKDGVTNVEHVRDRNSKVYHVLGGPVKALLQKGVIATGSFENNATTGGGSKEKSIFTDKDARQNYTYTGGVATSAGFSIYYVVLANDGPSRLYLNEIQDKLPKGFRYLSGTVTSNGRVATPDAYTNEGIKFVGEKVYGDVGTPQATVFDWGNNLSGDQSTYPFVLQSNDNKSYTGKNFGVHVTEDADGLVRFKIDNYYDADTNENRVEKGNLSYDENVGKYYLSPGEFISFSYFASSDKAFDDVETNNVGMPFFDRGTGVTTSATSVMSAPLGESVANDGNQKIINSTEAANTGFVPVNSSVWLTSSTDQVKPPITPGITKKVVRKTKRDGNSSESMPTFASPTDTLTWLMNVTSDSHAGIHNYVFTDIIDAPYVFTGPVRFYWHDLASVVGTPIETFNLFTFGDWKTSDGNLPTASNVVSVEISGATLNGYAGPVNLTVDGNPVIMKGRYFDNVYSVALKRTDDGRLRLDIEPHNGFYDGVEGSWSENINMDIPSSGVPESFEVSTINYSSQTPANSVFNEAYLTPLTDYGFDAEKIINGSPTELTVTDTHTAKNITSSTRELTGLETRTYPSVVTSAMIPISEYAATASIKHVYQRDAVGPTIKDATGKESVSSEATSLTTPNYITLEHPWENVTYTLDLQNQSQDSVTKFTIIDTLPQVGDHYTFSNANKRYSQFQVDFAQTPNVQLQYLDLSTNQYQNADPSKYQVWFSSKTEIEASDWDVENVQGWVAARYDRASGQWSLPEGTKLIDMRSIRVGMVDGEMSIPSSSSARVVFDAHIPVMPDSAQTAWNSFGYKATIGDSGTLEATPLKVGIRVKDPWALKMVKLEDKVISAAVGSDDVTETQIYDGTEEGHVASSGSILTQAKRLGGAVFGLYSPISHEALSDDAYNAAVASAGLMRGDVTRQIEKDGKTYFLARIQTTDSSGDTTGFTTFDALRADEYWVRELKAPSGYTFTSPHEKLVTKTSRAYPLDTSESQVASEFMVDPKLSFALPETGGAGIMALVAAGALITLLGASVFIARRRWAHD